MFFLKLFVIGRDSPAEVGQHYSETTSFSTLRLMLSHPPLSFPDSLPEGL